MLYSCGAALPPVYSFLAGVGNPPVATGQQGSGLTSITASSSPACPEVIRWVPPYHVSLGRKSLVKTWAGGDGEWGGDSNGDFGRENPFGAVAGDDWYMNTARMRYLREMEK